MLEFNNYYIKEQENLTGIFANIFVIIEDIYKKQKSPTQWARLLF